MDSTQEKNRLAARRTLRRRRGLVVLPNGAEVPWAEVLVHVAQVRGELVELEREAVLTARAGGLSWDAISARLGGTPTGERLRQKYGHAARS